MLRLRQTPLPPVAPPTAFANRASEARCQVDCGIIARPPSSRELAESAPESKEVGVQAINLITWKQNAVFKGVNV